MSEVTNKNELLTLLKHWKHTAIYNIFSQQSLQLYFKAFQDENLPYELPGVELIDGKHLSIQDFISELGNDLLSVKRSANAFITRNWLKETFRLVQAYANENKINNFASQNWYHFARLHVNAMSHNYKFRFSNADQRLLPLQYRNEIVTIDKNNTSFQLSLQTAFSLVEDIIQFANDKFE